MVSLFAFLLIIIILFERAMRMKTFDYFYSSRLNKFRFYMFPQDLMLDKTFDNLSYGARILYVVLLDMTGLAQKTGQLDAKGRAYVYYPIAKMVDELGYTRASAIRYLQQLVDIGLVEKQRKSFGAQNRIYVLDCTAILSD